MSNVERVSLPPAGATFDELCGFVGSVASVCSGRDLDDEGEIRVGKTCLVDAAGGTPSKPWEYVPIKLLGVEPANVRQYYKYCSANGWIPMDDITASLYNPTDFYVFKCRAINLVWYQLSTHRTNSPLKESLRYLPLKELLRRLALSEGTEYEFPPLEDYTHRFGGEHITEDYLNRTADKLTPIILSEILEDVYKRKELKSRDHNAFKLVNFYLCGTKDDFENMFNERSRNTKCQKETREFVQMIEDIVTA